MSETWPYEITATCGGDKVELGILAMPPRIGETVATDDGIYMVIDVVHRCYGVIQAIELELEKV